MEDDIEEFLNKWVINYMRWVTENFVMFPTDCKHAFEPEVVIEM